jgi:hypothetical protein
MRIPLPLSSILSFHYAWYTSAIVAKYFLTQLHPGQRVCDFASMYDNPFSPSNRMHMDALEGIGRYYHLMATQEKPAFQEAFDLTLARLNSVASWRESFDNNYNDQYWTRVCTLEVNC